MLRDGVNLWVPGDLRENHTSAPSTPPLYARLHLLVILEEHPRAHTVAAVQVPEREAPRAEATKVLRANRSETTFC